MEGDRERLKNEVSQLKSMVHNKGYECIEEDQQSDGNLEKILFDVKKRIGDLEAFLSGFGSIDGMDGNDIDNEQTRFEERMIGRSLLSTSEIQKEESQTLTDSDAAKLYGERLPKESDNVQHVSRESSSTKNNEEVQSSEQSTGDSKKYSHMKNESPLLKRGVEYSSHICDRGGGLQEDTKIENKCSDMKDQQSLQDSSNREELEKRVENNGSKVTINQEASEGDDDSIVMMNSKTSVYSFKQNIQISDSPSSQQKESHLKVGPKSTLYIGGLETPTCEMHSLSTVDENRCYITENPGHDDFNKRITGSTVHPLCASVKSSSMNRNHFTTKRQSLLMHLVQQETMFKDQLGGIVMRISLLEQEYQSILNKSQPCSKDNHECLVNGSDKEAIPKHRELILSDLQEGKVNFKDLTKQLHDLRFSMSKLVTKIDNKVSKNALSMIIQSLSFQRDEDFNSQKSDVPDEDSNLLKEFKMVLQQQLGGLQDHKVDKIQISNSDQYNESNDSTIDVMYRMMSAQEEKLMKSLVSLESEVKDCKQCISFLEDAQKHNSTNRSDQELDSIEERIKEATSLVELNLHEAISNRLDRLKTVEDEVERVASRLAEKPDQDQINNMLNDLEAAVSKRLGNDNTFEGLLDSMKSGKCLYGLKCTFSAHDHQSLTLIILKELNQRMTRAEVISMVKQLLKSAKENIQTRGNSLMIGHAPFRCLACNDIFSEGINRQLAAKVNHNALPSIRGGLSPSTMHLNLQSFSRPSNNLLPPQYGNPRHRSSFLGRTKNKSKSTSELRMSRRSKSMDNRQYNRYR